MPVKLTYDVLRPFVGGEIEIQDQGNQWFYRGKISSIYVEGKELVAELVWMARRVYGWVLPADWKVYQNTPYRINLTPCFINNIGPDDGEVGGGNRIMLEALCFGVTIILYPADGSKLDLTKVEGLCPDCKSVIDTNTMCKCTVISP